MSQKKRRMATVKNTKSNVSSKKWMRWGSFVVVLAMVVTGGWWASKPLSEWFSQLMSSSDQSQSIVRVERVETEKKSNAPSKRVKKESASWRIAIQNSADFVTAEKLERFVKSQVDDSFFTLNVEEVSTILKSYPWIKNVTARKVYPNILMLTLEEHQPWLNLNDKQLISHEGVIFEPDNIHEFEKLPLLTGKFGEVDDLLSMYHFFSEQMPENDYRIVQLDFSAHRGWVMKLENGIQLYLGKKELSERLERFLAVVQQVSGRSEKALAYIDLRYQSGVAVGWQDDNKQEQVAHK